MSCQPDGGALSTEEPTHHQPLHRRADHGIARRVKSSVQHLILKTVHPLGTALTSVF